MTNTIILSIDDLTYWVGADSLFSGQLDVPNIERIAGDGINFTNSYTPEAICNAARTGFFSGLSPAETGVHSNDQAWYEYVSPGDTLPAQFLEAGYNVGGFGKLLHGPGLPPGITDAMFSEYLALAGFENGGPSPISPLPDSIDPEELADHQTIDAAIAFLNGQTGDPPFVLNVGLVKPHLSWIVPQEYYDLYPLDEIEVPGLVGDDMSGVPAFITDQLVDSRGHPLPQTPEQARLFLQAYMASISYADAQIGRLLDALDALGEYDATQIVLWSDHGYHLGDHDNQWGKFTLWDEATRVPLIFKLPDNENGGTVVEDVVNLLDVYPTVLSLSDLPVPEGLSGDDLSPLIHGTGPANGDGTSVTWMFGSAMLRTADHVFIRYEDGSQEMYDMVNDPEQLFNLADDPAHAATQAELLAMLVERAGMVFADETGVAQGTAEGDTFYLNDTGDAATGAAGDDRYFINSEGVTISEEDDGGHDIVFTTVDFVLPDHVEELIVSRYTGTDVQNLTGNDLDNIIIGSTGSETIMAGAGDDVVRSGGGDGLIDGGDGNDTLAGWRDDDLIFGGAGNDSIRGQGGDDTIYGGGGMDIFITTTGNVQLFGGEGNDIMLTGAGTALMDGGAGRDQFRASENGINTVTYMSALVGVTASLFRPETNTGDADGDIYSNVHNLTGSAFADVLEGDGGANALSGMTGNDTLRGFGGDDTLIGSVGVDVMEGGAGFDRVTYAGTDSLLVDLLLAGRNTGLASGDSYASIEALEGGAGNDTLLGNAGDNALLGSAGDDVLYGRNGDDTLEGGAGDDTLFGGLGGDAFIGGAGVDMVDYIGNQGVLADLLLSDRNTGAAAGDSFESIEALTGTSGSDTLLGGLDGDLLQGAGGDDVLFGRRGDDTLVGGGGDDTLFGGLGGDTFMGGAGFDVVDYMGTEGLRVDMLLPGANTGRAVGDVFVGIEGIIGTAGSDTLLGAFHDDVLQGGAGDDILYGRRGDDTLIGGAGDDVFFGGVGGDTFLGGAGFDRVDYIGTEGLRVDMLLTYTNTGRAVGDTFVGIEALSGTAGNDTLLGAFGDDLVQGGQGNDIVYGRRGDDTLDGGTGNDVFFGGLGSDMFIFRGGASRIADFSIAEGDTIGIDRDLLPLGMTEGADIIDLFALQDNGDVVITFGGADVLTLNIDEEITDLNVLVDLITLL